MATTGQTWPPATSGGGGTTILSGTVAPTTGDGVVGNYYLDTDDNILYGPKGVAPSGQSAFTTQTPTTSASSGNNTFGNRIQVAAAGVITGIRYYRYSAGWGATHTLRLWNDTGTQLSVVTTSAETGTGWVTANLDIPIAVSAGQTIVASVDADLAHMPYVAVANGDLTLAASVYNATGGYGTFPNTSDSVRYFVDVVYIKGTPAPVWPVALTSGGGGTTILSGAAAPTNAIGSLGNYYLDTDDNILYGPKSTIPVAQSAYTSQVPSTTVAMNDGSFGNDFTFAVAGYVIGLRYYRDATSALTSRLMKLWTTGGAFLTSATTSGDTGSGWMTAYFAAPVAVTAGQTLRAGLVIDLGTGTTPTVRSPNFGANIVNGNVTMVKQGYTFSGSGGPFPSSTSSNTYFIDVLFEVTLSPLIWPIAVQTKDATKWGMWAGTQAQLDAIVTKDPTTLYVVV